MADIYRLADGATFETVDDGAVILVFGNGQLYSCNDTSAAFLSFLDGRRSLTEVAALMAAEFDAPIEAISGDLGALVDEMVAEGIIVSVT